MSWDLADQLKQSPAEISVFCGPDYLHGGVRMEGRTVPTKLSKMHHHLWCTGLSPTLLHHHRLQHQLLTFLSATTRTYTQTQADSGVCDRQHCGARNSGAK